MPSPRQVLLLALAAAAASACSAPAPRRVTGANAPAAEPAAALNHYAQVTIEPEQQAIRVEDEVTLSPGLRARLGDELTFSLHAGLSPERIGQGPPLARAASGPAPRDGGGDGGPARVPLEAFTVRLAPGERTFRIRYGGRVFHPVEDRGEEYARKMGESPGLVTKEGAVLSGATFWLPFVSDDLLTSTVDAYVPGGWDAISQGARAGHEKSGDTTWVRWESDDPQEEVHLVAGPWREQASLAGKVLLLALLRADDEPLARSYLDAAKGYLAMYDRLIGPYPYRKFALVENFWETGYGMPSFTLLGPKIVRLPFIIHSSYPHEILHDWWGNGVFVDPSGGNWSEGLTAYLADHLLQEQAGRGADYRRTALQRYADYVAASQDLAVRDFRQRHGSVTEAVGYDKVLMLFHMLRVRMGDERFVSALRRFWAEERFREASFADVARAMSAAAGEDLSPFFAEWVDRPGAPAIAIESARTIDRDGGRAVELELAQTQPGEPYAVDVPIFLTVPPAAEAVRRTVRLSERHQRFVLPVDAAPSRLDVDPEFDVFRRLDPAELPPALSGAFGAQQRVIVLPSAAPVALRAAYAALAESWRTPGTEVVPDAALDRIPEGKAVWVLGWENRLRDAVASALSPYGATLDARELRAGKTVLARSANAVVAAARSPADPAQVVAFLGADRAGALPGLARKLPHYGKYSLLGFTGDEPANVAKETWSVLASPMAVGFGPRGAALPARAPLPSRRPLVEPPKE